MMEGNLEDKVKEQVVRGLGRKNCDGVGVSTPEVVRYSFDSRKRTIRKKGGPCWTVVADVEVEGKVKERRGVVERRSGKVGGKKDAKIGSPTSLKVPLERRKKVVVIGSGPAGLFAALYLSKMPNVQMTLLERGQPVESRGRDIGALQHRAKMNTESNFAFGEGGAGTWSDGKLTTRIGRNSEGVRNVLERLVEYGAEPSILKYGAPHLGTDNLVRILRRMREDIRSNGGEVVFGAKVVGLIKSACGSRLEGVSVSMGYNGELKTRAGNSVPERPIFTSGRSTSTPITLPCDAAILATGHSARDVYSMLIESNVTVAPKGFAVGFRVEHPQRLVNRWQYGEDWAGRVVTGKRKTDEANGSEGGKGGVPVASYRLATDAASDGVRDRGCYSFCMCPGGQIVPASTTSSTVVVNGMSFSKRDSKFANSAVVVNIEPDDDVLKEWVEEHGVLAGVKFQEDMETKAALMGGGNFTVPIQRITDFVERRVGGGGEEIESSYRLGVLESRLDQLYPPLLTNALTDAFVNIFPSMMPGFLSPSGILHGVETRTSSPLRVPRDPKTMESSLKGLFVSGEGAGYAGGIVSAAVDGWRVGVTCQEVVCDE